MALTISDVPVILSSVAAIIAIGAAVKGWLKQKRWAAWMAAREPIELVKESVELLADAVGKELRAEEEEHRHQGLLPVRWVNTLLPVSDHWERIREVPPSVAPLDLSGHLAEHEYEDGIVSVFERAPSRRLVVLGGIGAGKTVVVQQLVSQLVSRFLQKHQEGDRVPVLLPVASWNSDNVSFYDWLGVRLAEDYPFLRVRTRSGSMLAQELVKRKQITPVLDGLDEMPDEMPEGLRTKALTWLNEHQVLGDPLVLTCRGQEYEHLVADGNMLQEAAVIELCPLNGGDLRAYLEKTTKPPYRTDKWRKVFAELELDEHSDGPLAQALHKPLMAWLARTVYSDEPSAEPSELLEPDSSGRLLLESAEAVEGHLLNALIPTVFERARPRGRTPSPSALWGAGRRLHEEKKSPRGWTGQKAQRWLTFLAMHISHVGVEDERSLPPTDLAWWNLYQAIPPAALGVAYSLVFVPIFGLAVGFAAGPGAGILFGLMVGLASGFSAGFAGPSGPSDVRSQSRSAEESRWEKYGRGAVFGLVLWLTTGLAATIVFGPATGIKVLAAGFLIGILGGGVGVVLSLEFDLLAMRMPVSEPSAVLKLNRVCTLSMWLVWGLVALSTAVLSAGVKAGLAVGLAVGFSVALVQAWGGLAISRACLSLSGRLPWRLMQFFLQARQLGVLRQYADVYQFRHNQLRLRLIACESEAFPSSLTARTARALVKWFRADEAQGTDKT